MSFLHAAPGEKSSSSSTSVSINSALIEGVGKAIWWASHPALRELHRMGGFLVSLAGAALISFLDETLETEPPFRSVCSTAFPRAWKLSRENVFKRQSCPIFNFSCLFTFPLASASLRGKIKPWKQEERHSSRTASVLPPQWRQASLSRLLSSVLVGSQALGAETPAAWGAAQGMGVRALPGVCQEAHCTKLQRNSL